MGKLKPGKAAGIDDILAEMIQHLAPGDAEHMYGTKKPSLLSPKPGKDPSSPKSYRPISLLCITYKLYERLLLQRFMPLIDTKLTKDQAGFRSCAGQLLNLTQHIEDGFEGQPITGAAFTDLSAAYDTVQHRTMVRKLLDMTGDLNLCHQKPPEQQALLRPVE
ncbi:hypothetical protein CesoFtcFv8_001658 [Champsocephalus esox]|uniref:Reverse transcriptase domain-containing protein n=1 Tax=Champsocephalus esox TaxID=159716 RepID=A0AAN8HHP3_9TELE|nr:hypothetical protein CesoFtcFv8_001658 [Champsocephalus esox]